MTDPLLDAAAILDELADAGDSFDKRMAVAQGRLAVAQVEALRAIGDGLAALTAEVKRANGPSIDDDPWEAGEQAVEQHEERQQARRRDSSSARRERNRGGGVADREARRQSGRNT